MPRSRVRVFLVAALVTSGALATFATTPPPPIDVRISVTVVDPAGKPVANAGVVLKQTADQYGRKLKHPLNVELKTASDGTTPPMLGFEPGTVVVQVIANGFQTWGQALKMSKPDEIVHVKLALPKGQISIYGH